MAISTTTPELIRNQWLTLIQALTPASHSSVTFSAARSDKAFDEWAEENPQACFRVFDVTDTPDRDDPSIAVSNQDVELALYHSELMVAYPHALALYGAENLRDMQDTMRADADQIRKAIGVSGGANYVSGQLRCEARYRFEIGETVSFVVFELEAEYYFDISSV